MFVLVIVFALVTNSGIVVLAQAFSSSTGPVIQKTVNTGNPGLDKQVNEFYGCISRITHEPQEPGKAHKLITVIIRYLEGAPTAV